MLLNHYDDLKAKRELNSVYRSDVLNIYTRIIQIYVNMAAAIGCVGVLRQHPTVLYPDLVITC